MPEAVAAICLVTHGMAWQSGPHLFLLFATPLYSLTHCWWQGRPTRPTSPLPTSVTTTEMHVGYKKQNGQKACRISKGSEHVLAERLES